MQLWVGLGNPGAQYALHRHNVGFMALDVIAEMHGFGPVQKKFQGWLQEGRIGGEKVLLLKPATFMNESGRSVGEALRFYKLVVEYRQRVRLKLVEAQRLGNGATAFVHEGGGLEQQHLRAADAALLEPALELLLHGPEGVHLGDHVERHEADVVPVHRVLRTRISEADPELHGGSLAAGATLTRPR